MNSRGAAVSSSGLSPRLLGWMVLGEWRAQPGRTLAAILAIAVGVGLGLAIHLVNRSALDEFAGAIRSVSGAADLQVQAASPLGFDEGLYPVLARLEGVATVSPVVELRARTDGGEPLTLLGLDPLRAAAVTPNLLGGGPVGGGEGGVTTAEAVFDLDAITLSPAALQQSGLRVGDQVRLSAAGQSASFRIVGVLEGGLGSFQFRSAFRGGSAGVHLFKDLQSLHAPGVADAFRKCEVGVFLSGTTNEVRFALLAEISGAGTLATDADERREVAERLAFMSDDGAESGMDDGGVLVESGLQFVLRAAVVAIGPGDGADERGVMHLLGKLRENFRDLHAIDGGLDGIKFTLGLAAGFRVPCVEVTHAAAVPKENDVFGLSLVGV